ncbi:hypothetical protein CYG49_01175 [Candidatus Saccharibacteria bacterium]|nr:MAG: hypothetical protein CYG49_01175 [Candidatus Saccharibacteria bacterium]
MPETAETPAKTPLTIDTTARETLQAVIIGAAVGLFVGLLTFLISRFLIVPLFCRSADSFAVCANGGSIAYNSALIIVSMVAVAVLAKIGVYRPLLVSLGAAAVLWGLQSYIGPLGWFEYAAWVIGLFALAYGVFFWILRLRNFLAAVIVFVLVIVLLRVLLAL